MALPDATQMPRVLEMQVEMFAANDISATDAVRTTEEGVEAIVASGVVSRISRVGEGVELFDLTRLNVRFDGL